MGIDNAGILCYIGSTEVNRCVPVSYTHLDVYKRQVEDAAALGVHGVAGHILDGGDGVHISPGFFIQNGIGAAAGISKGTLYYHYKTKNEIFMELTEDFLRQQWEDCLLYTSWH